MLHIIIIHPFHYKIFKYPSAVLPLRRSYPKQPIKQEIGWQCMCHQQSLTRSNLHPQEPLPPSKPQRLYRANHNIWACVWNADGELTYQLGKTMSKHLHRFHICFKCILRTYYSSGKDTATFCITHAISSHANEVFSLSTIIYIFWIHIRPKNSSLMSYVNLKSAFKYNIWPKL